MEIETNYLNMYSKISTDLFIIDQIWMVKLLHHFNLHKNEVLLCLLVEVYVLDGHLLPGILVCG